MRFTVDVGMQGMLLAQLEVPPAVTNIKFGPNYPFFEFLSLGNPRGPLGLSQAGRLTPGSAKQVLNLAEMVPELVCDVSATFLDP